MKIVKKFCVYILLLSLVLPMAGCSTEGNDKYRVVKKLDQQEFCVAFRLDDRAGDAVIAALQVLQDSGAVSELSRKWFGEDVSLLKADPDAIKNLSEKVGKRTFIIGYDAGRLPFSGKDSLGAPTGFDIELAKAVCKELGWRAKFISIDVSKAEVELNSGNVDCVWGGFAYDENNKNIHQSPVYMKNTVVLVSLKNSKIRRIGSLSGKTLTLSENSYHNKVLEENEALKKKPEFIVRVPNGTEDCFKALNEGSCSAIITDLKAIDYYK
ncbi:MAG: transporter substrate-binding domain-containing protein [Clostridiales bacterium]|nr:transporter substrate-binding domain-containing protein [Clostridiales bacterium]